MHADDDTKFDPLPWGARQRVLPRETFKVDPALALRQEEAPPPAPPAPPAPVWIVQSYAARSGASVRMPLAAPMVSRVRREADIATVRVPRFPADVPRRRWARVGVPLGGVFVIALLAMQLALGGASTAEAASVAAEVACGIDEPMAVPVHGATHVDAPPDAPPAVVRPTRPARSHNARTPRRPRVIVAGDTSTPLGNLRPRKF